MCITHCIKPWCVLKDNNKHKLIWHKLLKNHCLELGKCTPLFFVPLRGWSHWPALKMQLCFTLSTRMKEAQLESPGSDEMREMESNSETGHTQWDLGRWQRIRHSRLTPLLTCAKELHGWLSAKFPDGSGPSGWSRSLGNVLWSEVEWS